MTSTSAESSAGITKNDSLVDSSNDPYLWLEDVESIESLQFAEACNKACLEQLGNPETSATMTYPRILEILESKDRIPMVSQFGVNAENEPILYNFWKDQTNPKGIWRKTTLSSYASADNNVQWETVLDVDALAAADGISWVWKGSSTLARARDDHDPRLVTRALLQLSRGGSDAVHVREFDLTTQSFVTEQPFALPEAKTRVSYKSRNVVLVGSDFGPDTVTDSGYPRQVREWVRGTDPLQAPVVFEGEKTDVSVGMYIVDERVWGGRIYEVQYRSLTFYTSKYWIRPIQWEHLLASTDPRREGVPDPGPFVPVPIPDDANMSFLGKMLIITLRSDWNVAGTVYKQGSAIITDLAKFIDSGDPDACEYTILFEPTERTAYEYYTATKNYLILSTMENVKSKLSFYKIVEDGSRLELLDHGRRPMEAQIRDCSVSPVDPYLGSDAFWFSTSDFVTPSTLYLADATQMDSSSSKTDVATEEKEDPFIQSQLKRLPPQYDSSRMMVEQRFATSKDGTEIPYFIIMPKDTVLNGENPTLLYGYGGFEVSLGPHYVATAGVAWLERGGVYVEANIRGGGEFGPAWHQAGLKANRNKCYEDFIAVAEHLIASGICTSQTLAARGGSNGGLLMGNMYTMRPDLFGAIHCAVPLLDMQRYHTLLAGASWMAEYGNPDTEDWQYLKSYSPYHNIDPTANYPPILVTTSTRDDRVHPGHARKFVKKLMDTNPKWPVYYYENMEGGHGGAADAKQTAFMTGLAYDFMFATLTKNVAEKQQPSASSQTKE